MPSTDCMPGEEIVAVFLIYRGREYHLRLSLAPLDSFSISLLAIGVFRKVPGAVHYTTCAAISGESYIERLKRCMTHSTRLDCRFTPKMFSSNLRLLGIKLRISSRRTVPGYISTSRLAVANQYGVECCI